MATAQVESGNFVKVGIDFGGDSCRLSVVDKNDKITLHVNRVSNRQTPALVAFDKRLRIYGEEADARSSTLFKNTVPLLSYIVGLTKEELEVFVSERKYLFFLHLDRATGLFSVTFDDASLQVDPLEPFSFFVNKVLETVRSEFNLGASNEMIRLGLSVPGYFSDSFKHALRKSLSLANLKVNLFKESECILKRWADSQLADSYNEFAGLSGDGTENAKMRVAFLDVGFVHATFFVAEVASEDSQLSARIVSEASSDSIGTYHVVENLCEYVRKVIRDTAKVEVEVPSKKSYYLYKSCVKCVKELSVLSDAKLDVERVLEDDEDFTTNVTRDTLEQLNKPVQDKLCGLIEGVLAKVEGGNYLSLEILGGGSRIPFVKNVANSYAESLKCLKRTRTSLDTTSAVSYGAAQLLRQYFLSVSPEEGVPSVEMNGDSEDLDHLLEKERMISAVESEQALKMTTLNEIDNYFIKTKSDLSDKYRDLVADSHSELEKMLEELQNFSYEAIGNKGVTALECQAKLRTVQERLGELAPKYIEQLEQERISLQKEREEFNNSAVMDRVKEVDMDVVLPNSTCLKRAQKNKEEGNELIGAGNIELAIQHYVKVIQYCAKVNNPTEEEKETINGLRLASNLNLAMCYIKLDVPASLNKAVSCCTSALSISPTNTKALFRRAVAYEKLNDLDNALKDANAGIGLDSQNQDFKNMCDRVEKKIKLQLQKQKKVFSRMFA